MVVRSTKFFICKVFSVPCRMTSSSSTIWSFGFGSNMDVKALEAKKHVKVLGKFIDKILLHLHNIKYIFSSDHAPAILKDYKLAFNMKAMHHVEPAFAGLIYSEGSEVHGVAFCMSLDSMKELDRNEGGGRAYDKKFVTFESYDGRSLEGYIYINKACSSQRMILKKIDVHYMYIFVLQTPTLEEFPPSARYLGV